VDYYVAKHETAYNQEYLLESLTSCMAVKGAVKDSVLSHSRQFLSKIVSVVICFALLFNNRALEAFA
jgi:hypothetical protein